ncbi:MAG: hypothetical protein L0H00_08785 [Micrococcales bacterium]|nr:hypothetical protein [Micrococcales bacterium]
MSTSAGRTARGGRLRLPRRRPRVSDRQRASRRAMWSRLLPVAAAVLAVLGTFAVILLMNVRITDGQYRLVELRNQEQALELENESLTQDLEFHQAPQNLARSAQEEGLVPAPTEQGVVDLSTGEVTGVAVPAPKADDDEVDTAIPAPIQVGSSAAEQAQKEERARRDALPSSESEAEDQLDSARKAEADAELHGGTIPAPQQRGDSSADDAAQDEQSSGDGNREAPEGHTPLSGPAQTPQTDSADAAGAGAADDAAQDGTAQGGTAQEGADQ